MMLFSSRRAVAIPVFLFVRQPIDLGVAEGRAAVAGGQGEEKLIANVASGCEAVVY